MKFLQHIILLVSILWIAEDIFRFIHQSHDTAPIAIELSGEEKVENKSEYEIKEYLSDKPVSYLLIEDKVKIESSTILYQAPVLSIPEVPPEHIC